MVGAEERGKPLATHTAAALAKSSSPPSSYPSVENTGGAVAGPRPGGSLLLTDEGLPKRLSRKTLVEFPQKVLAPPPRAQGPKSKARQHVQKVTNDSSSSSSSSSSDSDSDEEEHDSDVAHQVARQGKAGFSKPTASRPFKNGAPKIIVSAKEKGKVQKPHTGDTSQEKSLQPKKKGTVTKPIEDHKKASSKPTASSSRPNEILEQNVKEERQQGKPRRSETGKEHPKPPEAEGILPDHTKARRSAQLTSGPVLTARTQEASAGQHLAATPLAEARHPEPEVPEPAGKAASPPVRRESLESQPEGCSEAEESLGDQKLVLKKTAPVQKKDTFIEKAGPELEGRFQAEAGEATPTDAAPPQEVPGDTQGTPCLGSDSPFPVGCIDPKSPLEFLRI